MLLHHILISSAALWLAMIIGSLACFIAGQRELAHYRDSLPLVLLNLGIVELGIVITCTLRSLWHPFGGESLWAFLAFFMVVDALSWCGHWLVHERPALAQSHTRYHHAKRHPYGLDQFYQHPIDNLLVFSIPGALAYFALPLDVSLAAYAFCLAVIANVLAHGPFGWEHLQHHLGERVSLGGGVWFDWAMGTSRDTFGHKLMDWGVLVAAYAAYLWWPWALALLGLYLAYKLVLTYATEIPALRIFVWRTFYGAFDRLLEWSGYDAFDTMNWGYTPDPDATLEHPRALHLALYAEVLGDEPDTVELLEVGSGRGGGAFALAERGYARITGLDLNPRHVARCRARAAARAGTPRFVEGEAGALPFETGSFEVLLNVESSHCYPDFNAFVDECHRVLAPGGRLRWCDFRTREQWQALSASFARDPRWQVLELEELTPGVLRACELMTPWYLERLEVLRGCPPIYSIVHNFACLSGSPNHGKFVSGEWVYARLVLVRR